MKTLACRPQWIWNFLKSFLAAVLFSLAGAASAAPIIGTVTVNANPVSQYTKFELTFSIGTDATNLFNPAQIAVSATFTGPTGTNYTINGFAYQGYVQTGSTSGQTLTASGGVVWKVRFSPPAAGNWSYVINAKDNGGTSTTPSSSFSVISSSKHGFVQLSKVDPHYFAYSDGTAFFPVGENMDWPDENFDNNIYWYNDFLPKLAAQGGNWIRVWMSNWCFGIENKPGSLNNYEQDQAWLLDNLFGQLEQSGMVVQLCLNYANDYNSPGYSDWNANPYSSANGGPLTADYQIWTNATAQGYLNLRWRYITARWGYSTSLLDYELFNEVDNTDQSQTYIDNGDVAAWHNTNRNAINSLNPQTHPVSTSFDSYINGQQSTWANLDFTQWHQYGNYPSVQQSETAMDQQYVPTFFGYKDAPDYAGEMGTNWMGPSEEATSDPNGVAIHEVNWASLMTNAAGGGFIWWWDNYVDPNNLYFNWKGISAFVAGEDLDKRGYTAKSATPGNENGQPLQTLYIQGSQKVLGWVEDQNHQWAAIENGATVGTATAATQSISGLSPDGSWQLQWWNTTTGVISQNTTVSVVGGVANLTVPTINSTNPDWAFKLFSAPVTASTWRVNAGGPAYTDSQGNIWAADENYNGGSTAVTTSTITGSLPAAADETLYQSQRYGNPFTYTFNVPAGSYQVTLKFAETYWTAVGDRVFNVSINGSTVLTNFDIYKTAGGIDKAIDEVFSGISPSGGTITIEFGPASVDNAMVDAIQIVPQPSSPTATPTKTATPTLTPTVTPTPTPLTLSTWRVNAGGPSYTDSKGNVWVADTNYTGGTEAVTTSTITNSSDSTLYQSQRYANSFSYSFYVPAGSYQVSLLFAETYWTAAGQRVFNVSLNGSTVLTNFDIFATAGAQNKAVTETFNNIAPSGGTITIQLGPASVDNAEVQGILITPMVPTPTSTKTPTVTATFTLTSTVTSTLTSTNTPVPPTLTFSPTWTSTFTHSATLTPTSTLTNTLTTTPSSTSTNTPVPPTLTLTSTRTSSPTGTPTSVPTASFTVTATNTLVPSTVTPTNTSAPPTFTFTSTLTSVPVNTNTPTITFTGIVPLTSTSTNTVVPPTLTFTLTNTPVPPTLTPTLSPTAVFTNTFTRTPTTTSTLTDTPVPPTFTWTPTKTWTPVFTNTFTFTKTNTPVPTNTYTFTRTYTPVPTNTFTITPTWTPTISSACAGVAAWSGNFVYYAIGARVTYNAELYQCIQAHTSESTWEPPVVPALWKDLGPCTGAAGKISLVSAVSYPNPSTTGNTTLYYQIQGNSTTGSVVSSEGVVSEPGSVVYLKIYSTAGRLIWSKTMTGQETVSGDHNVAWNCKDASGVNLANGVYYYTVTLKTPENQDTKKVPLLILR